MTTPPTIRADCADTEPTKETIKARVDALTAVVAILAALPPSDICIVMEAAEVTLGIKEP